MMATMTEPVRPRPTAETTQTRVSLLLLAWQLKLVPETKLGPLVQLLDEARSECNMRCLTAPGVAEKLAWWELEKRYREAIREGNPRG